MIISIIIMIYKPFRQEGAVIWGGASRSEAGKRDPNPKEIIINQ